jgi:purine-binding chemotaxis protein CheW
MDGQLLTVRVGEFLFGAPVAAVTEILADTKVMPIPRTPPTVAGVVVVRGQALTVLTLRPTLGLTRAPVHLALRWGGHRGTSLIAVDAVNGLWNPVDPLPDEQWQGMVPPAMVGLVESGYRWASEWLWAWAEDLPDRLQDAMLGASDAEGRWS